MANRRSGRMTADGLKTLNVNSVNRQGNLSARVRSSIPPISSEGEVEGIQSSAKGGHLTMEYDCWTASGDQKHVSEVIMLDWTKCNYGGVRPWFICPGAGCGRRVGKLYMVGMLFRCRHCHDLAYDCQRETRQDRIVRRVQKIRMQLGGTADTFSPFPWKPKGMHWKTYWRRREEGEELESLMWEALARWIARH